MNTAFDAPAVGRDSRIHEPFAAQATVAQAIRCYRTQSEIELARANCLALMAFLGPLQPDDQLYLKSCLIALGDKLSFGFHFGPSTSADPLTPGKVDPASCQRAGGPDSSR